MVAWITVIHQIGSASAAYLGGVLRIEFGTYLEAFILSGILLIGAALMVLFVGADGRAHQREIAAASLGSVP
jgi:predicted MFS family arabinose efflux permease